MVIFYVNWQGAIVSNEYGLSAPEVPAGTVIDLYAGLSIGTLSSFGDMRALERTSNGADQASCDLPEAARMDYQGGSILMFVDPKTFNVPADASNPSFFELLASVIGGGNGLVRGYRRTSDGALIATAGWNNGNANNYIIESWPSTGFWLWLVIDPDNSTAVQRMRYKLWEWGESVPESFSNSTEADGAALSAESQWTPSAFLRLANRDQSVFPIGFGPIVISDDQNEDMTAFLPSSAGATLETPTATSITQTTATIGCTTDSATGTLYGVVTTSATPPSEAQVAAGQDHTGATAAASGTNASLSVGANTINVTGLTADTTYYSHFVQDEGTAEYSNVLSSTSWNTLEVVNSPAISAGAITNRTVDGFTIGFTTDTANGTAYYAVYTTSTARNAATAQDIVDESTSLDAAVAAGSKAVTVAEAQTFTAVSGLDPDTPYYVAIVHYGDAQA